MTVNDVSAAISSNPGYLTFLVASVAWGFVGNSYAHYARMRGWPVLAVFERWSIGAIIAVPLALFSGYDRFGVTVVAAVLLAGYVAAWLATITLGRFVQLLWLFAPIVAAAPPAIRYAMRTIGS